VSSRHHYIKLNPIFYLYIIFVSSAYFVDVANLLCKIISINIDHFVPWLVIGLIVPMHYFLRSQIAVTKLKYPSILLIISVVIIGISFVKIPLPDKSFDTLNYHLFLQENRFVDNINYNFFPNGIQSFQFFLSDNIYYIFRYFLGYRLGTIINSLLLIVIAYQVIIYISSYLRYNHFRRLPVYFFLFGLFSVFTIYNLANIGIYYVDLIAIPILIYMLQQFIFKNKLSNSKIFFLAFLTGLSITLKLTFGIFSVPLFLLILVRHRQNISRKAIFFSLLLVFLTCSPALLYVYNQTGNPFFPLFNSIFHSSYYGNENLINRNAPHSIIDKILWPIIIFLNPHRLLLEKYDGRLLIGYLSAFTLLFLHCINKIQLNRSLLKIILIFLLFYFAWAFGTGYLRYGLILGILSAIIIFAFSLQCFQKKHWSSSLVGGFLLLLILSQSIYSLFVFFYQPNEWSWRNTFMIDRQQYQDNFPKILHDYRQTQIPSIISEADIIGVVSYNSGYATLLNLDKPLISFKYNGPETDKFALQKYNFLQTIHNKKIAIIDKCDQNQDINSILLPYNYTIKTSQKFYNEISNVELCAYAIQTESQS